MSRYDATFLLIIAAGFVLLMVGSPAGAVVVAVGALLYSKFGKVNP